MDVQAELNKVLEEKKALGKALKKAEKEKEKALEWGLVRSLCTALFWSGAVSWSSVIWCTTSQADTLRQDNEFLCISILLYDLLAIFSM